jgi:hypothetical protein
MRRALAYCAILLVRLDALCRELADEVLGSGRRAGLPPNDRVLAQ